MKVIKLIASSVCILSIAVSFTSCDWLFAEDYGTKGYLKATISEDGYLPSTPEEIQVRYYDNYSNEEYSEKLGEPDYFASSGTFLSRLRTGNYRFLAYSVFNSKIRNASDITQIEIYTDTVMSEKYGEPIYVNELHPVFTGNDVGMINPEDTTYRAFIMVPMVQKIVINMTLLGLSVDHTITTLEAMLSGVCSGRKVYTNQPLAEYAGLIFHFSPTEVTNRFTAEAYVFGISNAVPNALKVECIGESFRQYQTIDLSSVLKDFTTEGMVIDLVVEIGENMQMDNIYIDSWQDMHQSDINFGNNN